MKTVCLVEEQGGDYDSSYNNVILAFETKEEGIKAVELIQAEMAQVKLLTTDVQRFNDWIRENPTGDRTGRWEKAQEEYRQEVKAICKVYPFEQTLPDGRNVCALPNLRDYVDFIAYTVSVSELPAL